MLDRLELRHGERVTADHINTLDRTIAEAAAYGTSGGRCLSGEQQPLS
jgi:hypothetical protein